MAAFEIRDDQGRVYPYQSKRQAPDFFFQTQIYRESGESIRLPRGKYTVKCSHGPESIVQMQTLNVGDDPVTLNYQVERWIDTAKLGYWSGDHHIHAAGCLHYENPMQGVLPKDMLRHIMGEDVKVGCCLTWGPCFDFQKQFFSGKPDDVSRYPYLLRYDIEVSGFGSHQSGHLNLLKLRQQIPAGGNSNHHWPTLGMNTLRWAKQQGSVTGTAHSGAGLTRSVGRVEGTDGPHRLPNFDSRLLALAHHCFRLVQSGTIINQSELAHFGQISTTRMTQIMWLDNLAPDIQEDILFLPRTTQGRDAIKEADIRPIAKTLDWDKQRQMWRKLKNAPSVNPAVG